MLKLSLNTLFYGIVIFLLLSMLALPIESQKKKSATKTGSRPRLAVCTLTVDESPRLRGFYLNQKEEEISRAIASFHKAYEAAKDELLPARIVRSDFREVRSDRLGQDLSSIEEYSDVSFVWQFWGGRVVQLSVTYEDYEPMNMNDFLEQVSSTTGLPLKAFTVGGKHKASATCDGFAIELIEGSMTKAGWVPSESQVILRDTTAVAALDAEEKEVKKEIADDEAKRKADAEKKKRTFKP